MDNETLILKVLVGSRAHGLHTEGSDYDWRGVFIVPTEEIFKVNAKLKETNWIEGKEDNTTWEIGHFMKMATQCNPTILETFVAPVQESNEWGLRLRDLFPYVWDPKRVADAFVGYGLNQRKKFLEEKDKHANKFAVAYLRTLIQAEELLSLGALRVSFADHPVFERLKHWKNCGDQIDFGEVINVTKVYEALVGKALEGCKQEQDLDKINEFMVNIRKAYL